MAIIDTDRIASSLEKAGDLCPDPAPLVYRHLFAAHPDMEALFIRDSNGAVRGEMLARVFEMILDFIDRRTYAAQMIQCEVITHEGYGVPPEIFGVFVGVVRDTIRELLGAEWSPAEETAWREMLAQMDWFATHPSQMAPAAVG